MYDIKNFVYSRFIYLLIFVDCRFICVYEDPGTMTDVTDSASVSFVIILTKEYPGKNRGHSLHRSRSQLLLCENNRIFLSNSHFLLTI